MRFGLREAIFILLLLAMPTAAYFFVFQPRNEQIASAREEVRRKQDKLALLEQETANMSDLGKEIDKLTAAIEAFEQKLPAQREVDGVLKEVWKLTAANKLTPKSVRTDKIDKKAHYAELPIKMQIIGDFDGFYNFLMELEKLPRITRMPKMKLKKHKQEEQDGTMTADVVLSIFFEGEEAEAAASRRSRL
jgi:type IV pilus assembly protein PilO